MNAIVMFPYEDTLPFRISNNPHTYKSKRKAVRVFKTAFRPMSVSERLDSGEIFFGPQQATLEQENFTLCALN